MKKSDCDNNIKTKCPTVLKDKSNGIHMLNISPRRMWGWGLWAETIAGYCAECSTQTCMIYYGNYCSQEQILKAAGSSLLLGNNQDKCFKTLHMDYEYVGKKDMNLESILSYIQVQLDNNNPVIIGLYVNELGGDLAYDHVCSVIGYTEDLNGKIKDLWITDGYLLFPYKLSCLEGLCYQTRSDMTPDLDYYAPYFLSIPNIKDVIDPTTGVPALNEIVSFKGNIDPNNELYRVMLEMDSPMEPNWGSEDQIYAPPKPISCKCLISGLKKGDKYSLLRFDNPNDVPKGKFISSGTFTLRVDFTAECENHIITVNNTHDYPFMSDGTYFFRCVKNTSSIKSKFPLGTNRTDKKRAKLHNNNYSNEQKMSLISRGKRMIELNNNGPFKECDDLIHIKNNNISCAQSDYFGSIHDKWIWKWPKPQYKGSSNYGCMEWTFKILRNGIDITVAPEICSIWIMTCKHPDLIGEDNCTGIIGLDGRIYIDCMDNPLFMSFSLGPVNSDGSFTLLSQDGVTVSKITPVKK
jgi:hypothetical protein